jgi:hypothetical protein
MAQYYVNNNAQPNGDHEVHKAGCEWMPGNKTALGDHATCHSAVAAAKRIHRQSNGCYYCSRDCHTT